MKRILITVLMVFFGTMVFAQHDMKNMPGMKMPEKKTTITKKPVAKKTTSPKPSTQVIYTCTMHPQIKQSKPGNCPICGMTLVKKTITTPSKTVGKKPASSVKKTNPPVKNTAVKPAGNEMEEVLQEMKGVLKEMKTTVSEFRGLVKEMKGEELDDDTAANNEHMNHQMDMGNMNMGKDTGKAVTKVIYTCVMHPQIQQDKPGNCPICGMTLVKKTVVVSGGNLQNSNNMNMENMNHGNMDMGSNQPMTTAASGTVNMSMGRTVRVDLYVRDTIVNYTGKQRRAIAINGSIPAPTLSFFEGDTAEISLHNELKEETSLHWHGIILPNQANGVPLLTTKRVGPGDVHLYKFRIVQNGTYWYHSHSALQEQVGMYGALILKKRVQPEMQDGNMSMNMSSSSMNHSSMNNAQMAGTQSSSSQMSDAASLKHYNVVLSEWTDANPMQIQRRLRTGNDWFAIKKGSTQSYAEAIKEGYFKTKLENEWKRMKAMDVSDVFYERFLVNGKAVNTASEFKPGDKVMLHVVNSGASSYFWLTYAGGKITVVGNDGNEVVPVEVDRLIVAVAETYDVIITIPDNRSYEFRATAEDRTGYSSLWLGTGTQIQAPTLPRLKYFEGMKMMNDMMKTNGQMKPMDMNMTLQTMDMNFVMYPEVTGGKGDNGAGNNPKPDSMQNMDHGNMNMGTTQHNMAGMNVPMGGDIVTLNYDMLRSPHKTSLPEGKTRVLNFTLTGNMNRYVWTLDNKTVTETDRILINQGENLRLILTNNSMMRHPMHLHGHDFRVLNSGGEFSPLKNVIDIMPMETDTIEFAASQSGNWFFHCHILFHMMAGMGRVFTYANSPVNPELPDAEKAYREFKRHKDQRMKHLMVRAGFETNGAEGEAMLSSNRYALQGMWHLGFHPEHGYEGELNFGRYLGVNQWLFPFVGFDYHYKKEEGDVTKTSDYKTVFGQVSNKNDRKTFVAGIQYTTPWLMLAEARVDGNGKLRFQLSREDVPVTQRLRFNFMGNTDKEYAVGFRYIVSKWFALSTHYDSDMALGAGITITY